ncbi:MAG: methyltransferase domain-containing protein [Lentisphaeria bacterium]|nr:methyltransferase domain-containing protein [Lentisphaeria bacterium]
MTENEFRKIFDTIPEAFDRYRTRYCPELFASLLEQGQITESSTVLELGPGTGQATEPLLDSGCDYSCIELGSNFAGVLQRKYGSRSGFHLIHDDFITHDFGEKKYDLIYSAATIQWIPESVAFPKTFALLKPGGMLAMFLTRRDYKTPNPALYEKIQQAYTRYFKPEIAYTHGSYRYEDALQYGYSHWQKQIFHTVQIYTADEYVAFCGTHCDHIVTPEPFKSRLLAGLHQAVMDSGNRLEVHDSHVLMTVKKMPRP